MLTLECHFIWQRPYLKIDLKTNNALWKGICKSYLQYDQYLLHGKTVKKKW